MRFNFAFALFLVFVIMLSLVSAKEIISKVSVINSPPVIHSISTYSSYNTNGEIVPQIYFSTKNPDVYIVVEVHDQNSCYELREIRYKIVQINKKGKEVNFKRFGTKYKYLTLLDCSNTVGTYIAKWTMTKKDKYLSGTKKAPGSYRVKISARDGQSSASNENVAFSDYYWVKKIGSFEGSTGGKDESLTADVLKSLIERRGAWRKTSSKEQNLPKYQFEEEFKGNEEEKETKFRPSKPAKVAQLGISWVLGVVLFLVILIVGLIILVQKRRDEDG